MHKMIKYLCLGLILLLLPVAGQAAKYAGEIFWLAPGVENQAMGNTGLTNERSAALVWWNPALLALEGSNALELMHAEHLDGLVQYNHLAAVWGGQNRLGTVITHIGIDDIALTRLEHPELPLSNNNRPVIWKTVSNNDLMAFVGISRSLREHLHLGVTPKLAYRSLAGKSGYGFGADVGMLWEITPSLRLGNVLRDCFTTQIVWQNGTWESVLPALHSELGYTFKVSAKEIPVQAVLGVETLSEGRQTAATVAIKPFSLDLHAGLSVQPVPELKLMTGYDADAFTTGLGLQLKQFNLNYAFRLGPEDGLGNTHRISAGWHW